MRADLFGEDRIRCHYEKREKIAILTLDDEDYNGYTYKMFRDIDDCILKARFDQEVEVIIITGAGEHFCAGANIKMLEQADPQSKYYFCLHANETISRLEQTPKLVICAIPGHCVGGGFEIALACDLRVARKGGGRIGLPEVNLGVLPGTGGTQRLTRLVGGATAMHLMLKGLTFDTTQAKHQGLIHEEMGNVVDQEIKGKVRQVPSLSKSEFLDQVIAYAQTFTTPHKANLAVGHIKRAVQSGGEMPLEYGLAFERELQAKLFASHDAKEGLNAYVQKRTAIFEGK
jgi:enoyl-CoA hydratase/carnithine racemase